MEVNMPNYTGYTPAQLKLEFQDFVDLRDKRPLSKDDKSQLFQLACVMSALDTARLSTSDEKLLSDANKQWLRTKCEIIVA